jgi:hypothetical protein
MDAMDEETILFVLGDHGMTMSGDHGGDSQDELDAALFVYSPKHITSSAAVLSVSRLLISFVCKFNLLVEK